MPLNNNSTRDPLASGFSLIVSITSRDIPAKRFRLTTFPETHRTQSVFHATEEFQGETVLVYTCSIRDVQPSVHFTPTRKSISIRILFLFLELMFFLSVTVSTGTTSF